MNKEQVTKITQEERRLSITLGIFFVSLDYEVMLELRGKFAWFRNEDVDSINKTTTAPAC